MSTTSSIESQPKVGTNRWYLSAAPIVRALVHLCVPMAAAMIVGAVYNVINAGFIGSQHNTSYLAAITFGTPLLGLVMGVGGVFGAGGGALMSRLLGAAENDPTRAGEIKRVAAFSFWGAIIAGVVVGGVGLLALHPLVALLGANAAAVPATSAYVAVMLAFVPVLAAAFCLEQLVRSEGAARQVMTGLIGSTIANVVFDVLFILVLHWGVAGAALSMGLSNLAVVIYFVVWLQRHSENVSLAPRWFTLSTSVLKPVFGVGVGELLQSAFLIVTSLVLNNLAVIYGDAALAALGVAVRIAQVPEFLVMGVTIGVLPLLAYSFGKGDARRLRSSLRASAVAIGGVMLVFSGNGLPVPRAGILGVLVEPLGARHRRDRAHRAAGLRDLQRVLRPAHIAVPGHRPVGAVDRDVDRAGGRVRADRDPRQPVVRAARHHLVSHRQRGARVAGGPRDVAGLAPGDRTGTCRGQPRARRGSARAGRRQLSLAAREARRL